MNLLGLRLPEKNSPPSTKGTNFTGTKNSPQTSNGLVYLKAHLRSVAGKDRPRKGIGVLIDALELLPSDIDAHLLLIGKMHRKSLLTKTEKSSRTANIHLAGYRKDAPQIAAACSAFALPSLEREGLPRTVIEAMPYGSPAIISDTGENLSWSSMANRAT